MVELPERDPTQADRYVSLTEDERSVSLTGGTREMTDDDERADVKRAGRTEEAATALPADWADEPADPDPYEDLGYDPVAWERISVVDDTDRVIFLPDSDDQLKDDAFIVSATSAVCDLSERL